ncbi:DUF1707 domain-containing protein [Streptomyces sp. NPDC001904]|uniref:DUF1707 SHOCT-like domain-containing protein n=1 Tax=Streptomyces sp. NPDC001904 TaxID=3154531 RepID=UPI00332FAB83
MTDAALPDRPEESGPQDDALDLRASDADREQVAERLRDALAEGRLDMEEFGERLEETYKARTYRELLPVTRDLPGARTPTPVNLTKEPLPEGAVDWAARIGGTAGGSAWGVGILSGFERKGRWTAPSRFDCVAVMGGGELDLREANFESREIVVNCVAIMGGVNVIVPPGVEVVVRGIGIMGGFDHSESGVPGDPGAPRVVITGFAFWGGVGVERKLPKAERQRLKEERRRERLDRREDRRALLDGHHGHHGLHADRIERHRERMEEHLDRLEERQERRNRRRHGE